MSDMPVFDQSKMQKDKNGSPALALVEGLGGAGLTISQNLYAIQKERQAIEDDVALANALHQQRSFYQEYAKSYIDGGDLEGLESVLKKKASEISSSSSDKRIFGAVLEKENLNLMLGAQKAKLTADIENSRSGVLKSLEDLGMNQANTNPKRAEKEMEALMAKHAQTLFGGEEGAKVLKNARFRLYENTVLQSSPAEAQRLIEESKFDAVDKAKLSNFVRTKASNVEKINKVASENERQTLLRSGDISQIKSKNQDLYQEIMPLIGKDAEAIEEAIKDQNDPMLKKTYIAFLSGQNQALYSDPLGYASKSDVIVAQAVDLNNPDWGRRAQDALAVQSIYGTTSMFDAIDKKQIQELYKNGDYEALQTITHGAISASKGVFGGVDEIMQDLNLLKPELGTDLIMSEAGAFDFAQLQNAKAKIDRADINNSLLNAMDKSGKLFDQMPEEGSRMMSNFTYMSKFSPSKSSFFFSNNATDLFKQNYQVFGDNEYFAPSTSYGANLFKEKAIVDLKKDEQYKDFSAKDLKLKNVGIDRFVLGYQPPSGFGFYKLREYSADELGSLDFSSNGGDIGK